MCLAVPGKVTEITPTPGVLMGKVDFGGVVREVCLEAIPEVQLGNYVIVHDFHPEIVFVHTKSDIHQDHGTVTGEALRAFRGITVLGFDVIRSSYGFFPNFLVEVTEEDVEKKINALAQYHTYESKYYFNPEVTRATLVRHGALAERHYAEGFDILRVIGAFASPS